LVSKFNRKSNNKASKFGAIMQPFANSFGGITLQYVTPPPIQFVFYMMLYILRRMMFLVSDIILEKSLDLQILG
jgi:hypothetical protein